MVATQTLDGGHAYASVSLETLALLFGTMVMTVFLQREGMDGGLISIKQKSRLLIHTILLGVDIIITRFVFTCYASIDLSLWFSCRVTWKTVSLHCIVGGTGYQ